MLPCLSFPSTHPRTHLAQSHTLFLSLSFFPFLSRDFHSFRQRARRFPLRRSHTRAPFLPLSIMTHTALRKAAHPSLTASEKDSPREQFADPSARLAHDKRIRENPCTGICKYMCVCVCGCLRQPCYVYKRNPDLDVRRLIAGLTLIRLRRYDHGPYPPLRHPHHLFEKKLHPSLEEYDHRASSRCLR